MYLFSTINFSLQCDNEVMPPFKLIVFFLTYSRNSLLDHILAFLIHLHVFGSANFPTHVNVYLCHSTLYHAHDPHKKHFSGWWQDELWIFFSWISRVRMQYKAKHTQSKESSKLTPQFLFMALFPTFSLINIALERQPHKCRRRVYRRDIPVQGHDFVVTLWVSASFNHHLHIMNIVGKLIS